MLFGFICALQRSGMAPKLPCSIFDQWTTLRRHGIADFRIDIGLQEDLNTFAMNKYLRKGKEKVKKSRILVLGMVKDGEESLPALTKDLDALFGHMHHWDLVVCESCSTDRTRELLLNWRDRHSSERIFVPEPNTWSPSTSTCAKWEEEDGYKGIWGVREAQLAQMRNECILSTLQRPQVNSYDYMIMVDMDIFRIDYKGVLDSFGMIEWMDDVHKPWSVVCSNGKFMNGIYRDTYAHRVSSIDTGEHYWKRDGNYTMWVRDKFMHLKEREKVQRRVKNIVKDKLTRKKFYQLDSCFGGLAIYDMNLIQNCLYSGNGLVYGGGSKYLRPDCEHISFNACASGKYKIEFNSLLKYYEFEVEDEFCQTASCKPVMFNPRMQTWHGKGAWTGLLGPALYFPILFLGFWMSVFDAPLFLFSQDSLFLVSWIILYVIAGAAMYLSYQAFSLAQRRSLDPSLKVLRQSLKP